MREKTSITECYIISKSVVNTKTICIFPITKHKISHQIANIKRKFLNVKNELRIRITNYTNLQLPSRQTSQKKEPHKKKNQLAGAKQTDA